jgi:hypothetical protein
MERLAEEENRKLISLKLDDPTEAALSKFAGRIGTLLTGPAVRISPDLAGSLDDFLGAVYALIQAKRHDFTDRADRPIEIAAVEKRALQIAAGRVRTEGKMDRGLLFQQCPFPHGSRLPSHPENYCGEKRICARAQDRSPSTLPPLV